MSEWIKCSERLPDGELVLTVSCTGEYRLLCHNYRGFWEDEDGYLFADEDSIITHWMPLPDAPEVEG